MRPLRLALAMLAGLAISSTAACESSEAQGGSSAPSAAPSAPAAFRGLYTGSGDGVIGDLSALDDGSYVLRTASCFETACLETGTIDYDPQAKELSLHGFGRAPTRTFHVEVGQTSSGLVSPRTVAPTDLTSSQDDDLVDRDAPTTDGESELADTVTAAVIDGQAVRLLESAPSDGGATTPPWPGSIPGTFPLRVVGRGEQTTVHPGGGSVTVALPGDGPFVDDPLLAQRYAGRANLYNSHGLPGALVGAIPEADLRRFLNESDLPLIVASCFSGTGMQGGSTLRRIVSAYADDPAVASRVYGCTGLTIATKEVGLGCTGVWVDANQRAVPLVERQRLGLVQLDCKRHVVGADGFAHADACPD